MTRHGSLAEQRSEREPPEAANDNFFTGAGNLEWVRPEIPDMNHQEVNTQAAPLNELAKQVYEVEGFVDKSTAKFYFMYVISDIYGEFSKIGITNRPTKRLAQMQTGNPSRLFIHRIFLLHCGRRKPEEVAAAVEARAHSFAGRQYYRAVGEWFRCTPSQACEAANFSAQEFVQTGMVARYSVMTPPYDLWRA